jgi:hypothetical protein
MANKFISSLRTDQLTLSALGTGIAHINSSGLVSSSLLTNSDITDSTITQAKLSAGLVSTIVVRNVSGSVSGQSDNSGFSLGQIIGMGISDPTKTISLGYNTSSNTGYLNASHGASTSPIIINPGGGVVSTTNNTLDSSGNAIIAGSLTLSSLGTGVLHANSGGLLTSSLIINADLTDSTISESKLATSISTSSTANSIVKRGASNEISVGALNSSGLLTLSNYGTGLLHANSSGILSSSLIVDADITNSTISESKLATAISTTASNDSIVKRSGTGAISSTALNASGLVTLSNYTTAGILHNAVTTGLVSSSLIVDADITNSTISESKLATAISATATNNSIAKRDSSGGLAATSFNSSGVITLSSLGLGILHSSSGGLLSSSLIVDADVNFTALTAATSVVTSTESSFIGSDAIGSTSCRLGFVKKSGHNPEFSVNNTNDIIFSKLSTSTITSSNITSGTLTTLFTILNAGGGNFTSATPRLQLNDTASNFSALDFARSNTIKWSLYDNQSDNTLKLDLVGSYSALKISGSTGALSSKNNTLDDGTAGHMTIAGNGYFTGGLKVPSGSNNGLYLGNTNALSTAASNGSWFSDALANDMVIRSQSNNLLIGAGTGYSNLKMTTSSNTFLLPVDCQQLTSAYQLTGSIYQKAATTVTIIPGVEAGSAPTYTLHPPNCSLLSGYVQVAQGGTPGPGGGIMMTVTFSGGFPTKPSIVFSPATADCNLYAWLILTPDQGGGTYDRFEIHCNQFGSGYGATQTLGFNYHVILNAS